MFATFVLEDGPAHHLEFGEPPDPPRGTELRLQAMMDEYDLLRGDLWEEPLGPTWRALARILDVSRHEPARLRVAIRAAGDLGWHRLAAPVVGSLDHRDPATRLATVRALGQMGATVALPRLAQIALDADTETTLREAATRAIGRCGMMPPVDAALSRAAMVPALRPAATAARAMAVALRREDVRAVTELLLPTDDFFDLCGLFPFVLGTLREIASSPAHEDLLRARASAVLGVCRARKFAPLLARFARDEALPVDTRVELLRGLGLCRVVQAVPFLTALLTHENLGMRQHAAIALGRIGSPAARLPLLARWDAAGPEERPHLLVALRRVSPADGAALLHQAIDGDTPAVRSTAFILEDGTLHAGLPRKAVHNALQSPEWEARRDAALLLAHYGMTEDLARLVAAIDREQDETRRALVRSCHWRLQRFGPVHLPVDAAWRG